MSNRKSAHTRPASAAQPKPPAAAPAGVSSSSMPSSRSASSFDYKLSDDDVHIFSMYSFKGGVGKTTLSVNLAEVFAVYFNAHTPNEKVLLVDADPQMNLSQFFLQDDEQNGEEKAENGEAAAASSASSVEDQTVQPANQVRDFRIAETERVARAEGTLSINPLNSFRHDPGHSQAEQYKPLTEAHQALNLYSLLSDFINRGKTDVGSICLDGLISVWNEQKCNNCMLLPGNPDLVSLETTLAKYVTDKPIDEARIFHYFSFFRFAIKHIAKLIGARYVLVDLNPNWAALNRIFVMSSDTLIIPTFPEAFSAQAVVLMYKRILPEWFRWADAHRAQRARLGVDEMPFNPANPRIFPLIVTNFNIRQLNERAANRHRNAEPVITAESWSFIERMQKSADPAMAEIDEIIKHSLVNFNGQYVIPLYPNISSLVHYAHLFGLTSILYEFEDRIPNPAVMARAVKKRGHKTNSQVQNQADLEREYEECRLLSLLARQQIEDLVMRMVAYVKACQIVDYQNPPSVQINAQPRNGAASAVRQPVAAAAAAPARAPAMEDRSRARKRGRAE